MGKGESKLDNDSGDTEDAVIRKRVSVLYIYGPPGGSDRQFEPRVLMVALCCS
jgi:hypothetical protein